ncbi:MAG: glycoside hydrolase family 18 protein [Bacilli bacterium]
MRNFRKPIMKKTISLILCFLFIFTLLVPVEATTTEKNKYRSVAYYYSNKGMQLDAIDVTAITHLNYGFAHIYHQEEGSDASDPSYTKDVSKHHQLHLAPNVKADLEKLAALKKKNPELKVLLAIGGWGARGFSDMAAEKLSRTTFISSVHSVLSAYNLDGVDLDWEYPVNGGWGAIKAIPEDKRNFTLLLEEMRATFGKDKLISIASAANPAYIREWTEFEKIYPIIDYVNIMSYDYAYGSAYHNSNLFDSTTFTDVLRNDIFSTDTIIQNYLRTGIPKNKVTMGIAFFGRAPQRNFVPAKDWDNAGKEATTPTFNGNTFPEGEDERYSYYYYEILNRFVDKNGFTRKWDDTAKVPYLTYKDKFGKDTFAIAYEDKESIAYKTSYVEENGLGGVMFWSYNGDKDNELTQTIAKELKINADMEKLPQPDQVKKEEPVDENALVKNIIIAVFILFILLTIGMSTYRKFKK